MKCTVCEGTSFTLDSGVQICNKCGTEVEKFVQFDDEEFRFNVDNSRIFRVRKHKLKAKKGPRTTWTDNEAYNVILHEWTKAMRSLGASSRFEKMVFELWVLYLQRSGMAFLQGGGDDDDDTDDFSECTAPLLLNKKYFYFPCKTMGGRSSLPNVINLECLGESKPEVLNFYKLLALIYLAVLLAEESILLMDIIRWCREGHIPFLSVHNLLSPDCKLLLQWPSVEPHHNKMREITAELAMFINIVSIPIPDVKPIIDRIVKLLRLPEFVGALALEHMKKINQLKDDNHLIGIEIFAIAAVIVVMKAYWGLNDSDEIKLSRVTSRINKEIGKRSKVTPLFCWEDWQRYMNKLIWYCGEIDPVTQMHTQNLETFILGDAESYAKVAWTEGIWRIGTNSEALDPLACSLSEKILVAQNSSLCKELNRPLLYKPTKEPLYSIVEQFVTSSAHGNGPKYDHQVQMGKELLDIDFSDTLFHQPSVTTLNEELRKCGSDLKIITEERALASDMCVFMPQPLKSVVKATASKTQLFRKRLTGYPSKSMKWLTIMCTLLFEVADYSLFEAVIILDKM